MSRDDEGDDDDEGGDEQLPRPEVALKEERHGGERRSNNATDGLRPEVKDDTRHETAHTAHQADEGEETLAVNIGHAHGEATDTAGESDEHPHHHDDILVECAVVGTLIVLADEIDHQRHTDQWDACPDPATPVFVSYHQRHKLHEHHDGRGVAPGQEQILASQFFSGCHLTPDAGDDVEFILSIHSVTLHFR